MKFRFALRQLALAAALSLCGVAVAWAVPDVPGFARTAVLIHAVHSNLCLQRWGNDHVTQEACNAGIPEQLWVVYQEVTWPCYSSVNGVCTSFTQMIGPFRVRAFDGNAPTDMCLSVPTYQDWPASWFWRTSPQNVWMTPCDGTASIQTNGYPNNFQVVGSGFCADVERQAWWAGAWLKGWECNGGGNQQFTTEFVKNF